MSTSTEAAVLVTVRVGGETDEIGFVRINEGAPNHAGHVAFPGGKRDPADRSLRETALREAREEVGIAPDEVDLRRTLPDHETRTTGFRIRPFVGRVPAGTRLEPDGFEVVDAFWVPVGRLPDRFAVREDGPVFSRPGEGPPVRGVTARVLTTLLVWEYGFDGSAQS